MVKHLPAVQETRVWSLGWEDPLEKEMATHSSTLVWKIPWAEELGRLQSMGSQRVRHDWVTSVYICIMKYYSVLINLVIYINISEGEGHYTTVKWATCRRTYTAWYHLYEKYKIFKLIIRNHGRKQQGTKEPQWKWKRRVEKLA